MSALVERHGGPFGGALQPEEAGYTRPESPNLIIPDLGTVPNETRPWICEKNDPYPATFEVGNAAQALRSLLRLKAAQGKPCALSLERSPLRYGVIVIA